MTTQQIIDLDTKNAWQAEQRKPKAKRRTFEQVRQAVADLYVGENAYAVVADVEFVKVGKVTNNE